MTNAGNAWRVVRPTGSDIDKGHSAFFCRNSPSGPIRKTIHYLQLLDSYGVRFKSLKEEHLTTDNELVSHICIAYLSYFANLESKKISERTIVGMARARDKGKQIGRPSKRREHEAEIRRLYDSGVSKSAIARTLGLSRETVRTYLKAEVSHQAHP